MEIFICILDFYCPPLLTLGSMHSRMDQVKFFKKLSSANFTRFIREYIVPCDNAFLQKIGDYISYSTKQIKCEVGIMESFKLDEIRANISRI